MAEDISEKPGRAALQRIIAGLALMVLAACGTSETENEANSSGGDAAATMPNSVEQSRPAPLQKEEALALLERRHENFERIGDAMKRVSRELKGETPDLGQVRSGAATLAQLAPQVPSWFPPGTGPDVGKTEARPEIWQKPEDFAAKSRAFREAAVAFNTAAQGTDLASIRSAQANLGKTCKGCHDPYRKQK